MVHSAQLSHDPRANGFLIALAKAGAAHASGGLHQRTGEGGAEAFVVIQGQAVTSGCRGLDADPLQGHKRQGMADPGKPGPGGATQVRKAAQPHQADSHAVKHSENRAGGLHRYEVGHGFQPKGTRLTGSSEEGLIAQAAELMSSSPSYVWRSAQMEKWVGPPAVWLSWGR